MEATLCWGAEAVRQWPRWGAYSERWGTYSEWIQLKRETCVSGCKAGGAEPSKFFDTWNWPYFSSETEETSRNLHMLVLLHEILLSIVYPCSPMAPSNLWVQLDDYFGLALDHSGIDNHLVDLLGARKCSNVMVSLALHGFEPTRPIWACLSKTWYFK